jgi:hypothetical protein
MPTPKTQDQILSEFILSFSPQAIQQKQPLKGADPKLLINNEASVPRQVEQASQIVEETAPVTPPVTPAVTPAAPVIDENTVDFSSIQEMPMQQPVQQESQLRRLLTDPRTYETIANLGAAYSAYRGNVPLAQTLSGIAGNIQGERLGREQTERQLELSQLETLRKQQETEQKNILSFKKDRRKSINDLLTETPKDENIKKARSALFSANAIRELVTSDTALTPQALRTQIPRLMGEVGNLTEQEQAAWTGDPRYSEKVKRFIEQRFTTGKLREEDKKLFIQLLDTLEGAHRNKIQQTLTGVVDSAVLANPDYYTKTELYQILEPRILSPKKIEPQETEPKQKNQTVTDKETSTLFGGE